MKSMGIPTGVGLLVVMSLVVASAQVPRFELTQKDLFAAGGSFVNAWADYDSDGDLDLFVGFDGTPNRLYRNDGGRFVDSATTAGIADTRPTRAAAWGDADNDGDPDLLVGFTPAAAAAPGAAQSTPSTASVLRFYRNAKGSFVDDTEAVGLMVAGGAVRQPVWVDFDGDIDMDLFVAFRDRPNAMFRNDNGRFVDVAAEVGLADARRTVGAVWFDHDEDGDLDVITGNMDGDANGLYSFDKGKFTDVAESAGVAWGGRAPNDKTNGTVRPCAADVDNDGHVDLFFANYGKNGLFINRGKGRFTNAAAMWGVDTDARFDSCTFGDMDNDGDLDLYVNGTVTGGQSYRDYLFRNTGRAFEDVTPAELGSPNSDHGVQWADYDFDGDLDLALTGVQKEGMHWLLRNMLPDAEATRGLNVRVLDPSGRFTLPGAEVSVQVRGGVRRTTQLVDAGSGYNTQNHAPVHVTLAAGAKDLTIIVRVRRQGREFVMLSGPVDPSRWRGKVYDVKIPSNKW